MPFIDEILKYPTLSIVGMEKNTGKTETLNYILKKLPVERKRICITSIGIDGESIDQVTGGIKPEIILQEGTFFATSEKHYKQRRVVSEIVDISDYSTSVGRVITAKVHNPGKVLISGPSSAYTLGKWIESMDRFSIDHIIIDGALSRLSPASPAISEAMILTTGAALSSNIPTLIEKSRHVVELLKLPLADNCIEADYILPTSLMLDEVQIDQLKKSKKIFIEGALTDRFLSLIIQNCKNNIPELVVKDFTKIFITPLTFRSFLKKGGEIKVLMRSKLIAITINPKAPNGFVLDSDKLKSELMKVVDVPVYNVLKDEI